MKVVAFLNGYRRPIGAELMTAELLEAVAEAGHEVTVYTHYQPNADEINGVRILPFAEFDRIAMQSRAYLRPDVVVAHPDYGVTPHTTAHLLGVPYVGIVHNTAATTGHLLRRYPPDLVVWNAHATRDHFGMTGGIVVRSPLKVSDHSVRARTKADAVTLVNVTPAKGSHLFHELAARIDAPFLGVRGGYGTQDERDQSPAEVVGPFAPGEMKHRVWARTKILLAPSETESWGRVAAEALCSGVPVIAHPTAGLRECLGDAALFIDRTDTEAWATAVHELLTDKQRYAALSKAAKQRAKELERITADDLSAFVQAIGQVRRVQAA